MYHGSVISNNCSALGNHSHVCSDGLKLSDLASGFQDTTPLAATVSPRLIATSNGFTEARSDYVYTYTVLPASTSGGS